MACSSVNRFDELNEPEEVVKEYDILYLSKSLYDELNLSKSTRYTPNPGDLFGPKPIEQMNPGSQKEGKPTIKSNCEYLIVRNHYRNYKGDTGSVKAEIERVVKEIPGNLKGVHYLIPESYIGRYSYGILVAHKEGLDLFKDKLVLEVKDCMVFLEGAYCSNCFKSDHLHINCENCSICREKHDYRSCPSLDPSVHKLFEGLISKPKEKVSGNTQRRKNSKRNKQLPDMAPHKIPYYKIGKDRYGVDVKYGDCAISCENGHTTGMPVCLRVAISAKVEGIGNCLIYTAFVNNSEQVFDHSPTIGSINANDVIHLGKDRMAVKADVLEVLKGHRVYGFDSKSDFIGLYIKYKDLKDNDIHFIDFHLMPRFMALNGNPNNTTSLRRLHYCYSVGTNRSGLLQEYDNKFRRVPTRAAHLDAKATLELGQSYEKVSKTIKDKYIKDKNFKGSELGKDLHFDFDTIKIKVDHDLRIGKIKLNPYAEKLRACANWRKRK